MANPRSFRSVIARDLRDALKGVPDDALVIFASDYGDHSHTLQVHLLDGELEPASVTVSAYSDSGWAIADSTDEDVLDSDPEDRPIYRLT